MSLQPTSPPPTAVALPEQGTDVWHLVHLSAAWLLTVASLGYCLPWAIAASRRKSNTIPIALLNVFLGWTIVGWIVPLVMACGVDNKPQQVIVQVNQTMAVGQPYPPALQTPAAPRQPWEDQAQEQSQQF